MTTQGAVRPKGLSHPPIAIDEALEIPTDPSSMCLEMFRPDDRFGVEGHDRIGA
jgi:hypothetical protein